MAQDIIARGLASKANIKAQQALDELAMVVEGTMNEDETVFTDLEGDIVVPNDYTVYQDVEAYVYYRWNGSSYYSVSDPRGVVRYTEQTLTEEEKVQARENIGAGTSNFSGSYQDLTGAPVFTPEEIPDDDTI